MIPAFPSGKRLKKGRVVVIECNQEIPCDPCEAACPRHAIKVKTLNSVPELDEEKCNGCGSCIARCPGLAIFVVDMTYSEKEALVMLPHEFLPVPETKTIVNILGRDGKTICKGKIIDVRRAPRNDRTPVVSVAVPKKYGMAARAIALGH